MLFQDQAEQLRHLSRERKTLVEENDEAATCIGDLHARLDNKVCFTVCRVISLRCLRCLDTVSCTSSMSLWVMYTPSRARLHPVQVSLCIETSLRYLCVFLVTLHLEDTTTDRANGGKKFLSIGT